LNRNLKETLQQINEVFKDGAKGAPVRVGDEPGKDGWSLVGVDFAYEKSLGRKVLENISFDIRCGEKIAIVGAGGSGKTTLSRLLLGLMEPNRGRISFNCDKYDRIAALREDTYYFPQKNFFYHDNLFEYFDCTDEERLKKNLSAPFMNWLPQTFTGGIYSSVDTALNISVDKMQMLEMCRFSLCNKSVWLFDEPSAFVGASVEKQFCSMITEKIRPSTTMLIFTGRSNLLHLVDRVIFLENGRVAFDGSSEKFISMLKP